eukprot:s6015_g7.t1
MGAGEASSYLAEILEGTEEEGQRIRTHSLKVTLLTWASRSTVVRLSKNERLLLGHHIAPGVKSMVTYSREGYTSLIGKVLALYRSIRCGMFNPDLQPAARVLQVADSLTAGGDGIAAGPEVPDEGAVEPIGGSDNESGGTATGDEDAAPFDLPGLPAVRVPFAEALGRWVDEYARLFRPGSPYLGAWEWCPREGAGRERKVRANQWHLAPA